MKVRDAEQSDIVALVQLGKEFADAAGLPDVDSESLQITLNNLMQDGILKVAENGSVQGAAGALVFPMYWNRYEMVAQELFWFLRPEYRNGSTGIKLLFALENAARAQGAKRIMMLCLDALEGDRVASIYQRLGYAPQERTYVKWL